MQILLDPDYGYWQYLSVKKAQGCCNQKKADNYPVSVFFYVSHGLNLIAPLSLKQNDISLNRNIN